MIYLSALLLSMFITLSLIPVLKNAAMRFNVVDMPNERKVHKRPIPRVGGMAMAIGLILPLLLLLPDDRFIRALLLSSTVLALFGMIDDIRELNFKIKLVGQAVSALILIFYGEIVIESFGDLLPDGWVVGDIFNVPFTLFVMIGVMNAINFADGLDGLAGGITMLSFICLAILGYRSEDMAVAVISVSVIGAIFGFLRFNTFPATIFMGDTGSQLLGLLAIALSLKLTQGNTPYNTVMPLILIGFPILDSLAVVTERIMHGRSLFKADKNHSHHKLMRLGLYHTEAVFIIYVLQSLLVTSAFLLRFHSEWESLVLFAIFSGLIVHGFTIAEKTGWQLRRFDFIDSVVKGKLKILRDKQLIIKVSYRIIKYGLPVLLLITIFIPNRVPIYFSSYAFLTALIILWILLFRKYWVGGAIRVGVYMTVPFLVYLSEANASAWLEDWMAMLYNLSFAVSAFFIIMTLKFTRRKKGFKTTPLDFLILFIALIIPNLPGSEILEYSLGMLAVKIIVLMFGFEVLLGEFRQDNDGMGKVIIFTLLIFSIRGFYLSF